MLGCYNVLEVVTTDIDRNFPIPCNIFSVVAKTHISFLIQLNGFIKICTCKVMDKLLPRTYCPTIDTFQLLFLHVRPSLNWLRTLFTNTWQLTSTLWGVCTICRFLNTHKIRYRERSKHLKWDCVVKAIINKEKLWSLYFFSDEIYVDIFHYFSLTMLSLKKKILSLCSVNVPLPFLWKNTIIIVIHCRYASQINDNISQLILWGHPEILLQPPSLLFKFYSLNYLLPKTATLCTVQCSEPQIKNDLWIPS